MLSYSKSYRRNPRKAGQSLLEFALVLPLLLIVVAGVLDLGRVFFAVIQVTNAAREGVRYLTLHPDDTPLFTETKNAAKSETQIDISVAANCEDAVDDNGNLGADGLCDPGKEAVVTASHSFDLIMGWIFPDALTISRDAKMVVP
ncbi:MAG: pilus assembly protein [Anaerolineales bacterium]|jgi:hypothetical protein